jgi:hypothetical protein
MLLECRTHRLIGGVIAGDVGKRHAAELGGKARTQRDDIHRRASLAFRLLKFPPNKSSRQPGVGTPPHQCPFLRFQA